MMGRKERIFQPLPSDISLEELVPKDNFYRRLQERLDLSFVRELVKDLYAASGRPSVAPEVFQRSGLGGGAGTPKRSGPSKVPGWAIPSCARSSTCRTSCASVRP
jgi:hypothetical protein